MTLRDIVRASERFVSDNSPALLTAVGVAGTLTTAYLAGTASIRAYEIVQDEVDRRAAHDDELMTRADAVRITWQEYVPAASSAVLTVSAIIMANRIGSRRAAAVAAAYTVSEKAFSEYREKVVEKLGEKKEKEARDEIAADRVAKQYDPSRVPSLSGAPGRVLIHDAYSGRFFESTIETVNKAVNVINREINQNDSATVSDFYDVVGLSHTSISDEFGWNSTEPLTLNWTTCPGPEEGMPAAHSYDFESRPILRPWSSVSFR